MHTGFLRWVYLIWVLPGYNTWVHLNPFQLTLICIYTHLVLHCKQGRTPPGCRRGLGKWLRHTLASCRALIIWFIAALSPSTTVCWHSCVVWFNSAYFTFAEINYITHAFMTLLDDLKNLKLKTQNQFRHPQFYFAPCPKCMTSFMLLPHTFTCTPLAFSVTCMPPLPCRFI